jgi:hypothetical protein
MAKIREPKTLHEFSDAESAARGLEQIAAEIRANADVRPLVKWHLNLSFWNPAWKDPTYRPPNDIIVAGTSFHNATKDR